MFQFKRFLIITSVILLPVLLWAQDYAFIYISGGTTSQSIIKNTWTVVGNSTQADFSASTFLNNWTYSSNVLTAGASATGTYMVRYSLSFKGAATNDWSAGISIAGATPTTIISQRTVVSLNKDTGTISGSGIISITAGQTVSLKVKPTLINGTFMPIEAQITLVELTQATSTSYGGMTITSDQAQTPGTTFVPLTGFIAVGTLNDWTVASNELVAGASAGGTYLAVFSSTFTGIGAVGSPATYTQGLVKNGSGTGVVPTTMKSIVKANGTDRQHTTACGILSIIAGDKISVEVKTATSSKSLTTRYASVQLYKISGTTAPAYGSMSLTTDQTIAISTLNTWQTVGTFTGGTTNDWSFASNTLTPTLHSLSAGLYRVDYSLSFSSPTLDDRYSVSIFVGANRKLGSMSQRKIRSANYLGTVSASVLVNIASVDSTIKLKIRKDVGSTGTNVTIKKANVALYRLVPGAHDGSLPVELSVWKANSTQGLVKLIWTTDSEIENQGFLIERALSTSSFDGAQDDAQGSKVDWKEIASFATNQDLLGQGSTSSQSNYSFIDKQIKVGETYSYRLSDVDYRGSVTQHNEISVTVRDAGSDLKPSQITLHKAFPNPFNPEVNLSFTLENAVEALSFEVYDINGVLVQTLASGPQNSGTYDFSWNGMNTEGNQASSGVYLVKLGANSLVQIQRVTLLR